MARNWDACVAEDDIVITPGDFSWAGKPEQAQADFAWLAQRPGYKVLVKETMTTGGREPVPSWLVFCRPRPSL